MKKLLMALGILALICSPAMAGRNVGGAIVVHTDNSVIYTSTADYCTTQLPTVCEELNANGTGGIETEQVIWLLAAFASTSSPGVTTVQFGIEHNLPANQGYFSRYAACGPQPLELPDTGWPETGFGNLVAYGVPVYDHVFKFYWFAVFIDGPANYFGTRTYPTTDEAKFVDDGNPPVEDLVFKFGTVKWDGSGANNCPSDGGIHQGACCYPDGSCLEQLQIECQGAYQGDNTVCYPNPCAQPEACCFQDGSCQFILVDMCQSLGGTPQGPGTNCDPNLCPPPDVPEACCFQDGSCQFILAADCTAQGGTPQGAGTTCETVNCQPTQTGACCLDDQGHCQVMTEADCLGQNGLYEGDGSTCEPTNPCPIVPTRNATWGQIRANYR
jgi:hypothetical protein